MVGCTMNPIFSRPMRRTVLACLWLILCLQSLCCAVQERQISQFGITWTFDKDYPVGQFANGDYWVVGPVTIVAIDPASVEIDGRAINGSMVNPSPKLKWTQGYDSAMYAQYVKQNYDPNLNAARPNGWNLSRSNPLVLGPHSTLVSTESIEEARHRPQVRTAALLTVLATPAGEGDFRPPYCGVDKTVRFQKSQLDYSLLARLKPVPGSPDLTKVEGYFEHPWIDHIPTWVGRFQHPTDNMPDYGREMATQIGEGALMLLLNFTDEEKETLLVRYIQLGIDLYGVVCDGGNKAWLGAGGHGSGRKWPVLFAGVMLNDDGMRNIGLLSGDHLYLEGHGPGNEPPDYIHFGEDDQTFYVSDDDIYEPPYQEHTRGGFTYYGHGNLSKNLDYLEYQQHHKGMPEWGITHATDRNIDGLDWDAPYRDWCTANSWCGFVLAAHIMGARELWNHDALFDYMDRFMEVDLRTVGVQNFVRQTSRFSEAMWDAYRREYGPVWTMTPVLKITSVGGSVTSHPKSSPFNLGQEVVLSAYPDPGYEFTGWSGDLAGNENPARIIMYAHRYITATFAPTK